MSSDSMGAPRRWLVDGFVMGRPYRFTVSYDPARRPALVCWVAPDLTQDELEDMELRGIIRPAGGQMPAPRRLEVVR